MRSEELFQAFAEIEDRILERSEEASAPRRRRILRRWGALAACGALAVGLAGAVLWAEAREYDAAAAFFADNGLPAEGLSRSDMKAVYRDIITERFACDKTAEVLAKAVPGVEISQREPTPEELEELWNRNVWRNAQPGEGVTYRIESQERLDEALGFEIFERSTVACCRDGVPVWTAEFTDFYVKDSAYTSTGTAVWGYTPTWSSEQVQNGWLARVDEGGSVLWQRRLDHGFRRETVAAVLDNGDGTWAVLSRGDLRCLCLSQYDAEGRELAFHATEVGNRGIWNAARLGDGYLVQLGHQMEGETAHLVKLDREGNLVDRFIYEGEDCDYTLTDMVEWGGRIYLSAYAVPRQSDEGGRHEISGILDEVFAKENWELSSEELTPMVRDNYTAVLLLCGSEGGAPETFYSVKGSLGGALRVDGDGGLSWDVESVVSTFFSPATSSFTIGGTCRVFRYFFDGAGNLVRQEDTGETVPYRR